MAENREYAVRVKNLSKCYRVIHSPWQRLQYYLFHKPYGEDFYALQDVSFDIEKGETFGIIGINGSGKSTLLQVLSGIITKSSGEVEVNGKISALLELGSGFNPESTGYENIYLNAAILGVGKEDIDRKCADIIAFADIGSFINEPVKTYSSGMFIRLAFAVAINVDADVIIIDEALAVGDVFFRQKCYAKLNELKAEGKTIILVSHGMNEVEQFCDRALLLNHGKQIALGKSGDVVETYYFLNQRTAQEDLTLETDFQECDDKTRDSESNSTFFGEKWMPKDNVFLDIHSFSRQGNGMAHFLKIGLFDETGKARRVFKQGEWAYFYSEVMIDHPIAVPINGIVIFNDKNVIVHGKNSFQTNMQHSDSATVGSIICNCTKVKLDLAYGEYTFELGFSTLPSYVFKHRKDIPHEELNKSLLIIDDVRNITSFMIQGSSEESPSQLKFYGLTNMESEFDRIVINGVD